MNLQLVNMADRPRKGIVQTGEDPGRCHGSPGSRYCLLVWRHNIDTPEKPKSRKPRPETIFSAACFDFSGFDGCCLRWCKQHGTHLAPASPRVRSFNSSESEFKIIVVLSSRTFL